MQSKHLQAAKRKEQWSLFRLINVIPFLLLVIVASVIVWLWHRIQNPQSYPIEHVKIITKGQHISQSDLKSTILAHTHGGFFSLNTQELKDSLLYNPWVQDVSIRRIWPSTLSVNIVEQQPLARWGLSGVINRSGDIFYPLLRSIPATLPEIDAPAKSKDEILSGFNSFSAALVPIKLTVKRLSVTQRLSWSVWLSNGIQVNLCRDNVSERFNEFVRLYPQAISNKEQNIISVNLCYPNGLAIRWKDGKVPMAT